MKNQLFRSKISVDIQFRHMLKSIELQEIARQQADSLSMYARDDSRCEILFDQSHSAKQGIVHTVTIRLYIPGQPLYVTHHTEFGGSNELLFATLNNAFSDIRRKAVKTRMKRRSHDRLAA